jgi:hypothetical protein
MTAAYAACDEAGERVSSAAISRIYRTAVAAAPSRDAAVGAVEPAEQAVDARQLSEVINYAIAAYKKSIEVEKIFVASPTDANGWLTKFIMDAIEHYRPDVSNEVTLSTVQARPFDAKTWSDVQGKRLQKVIAHPDLYETRVVRTASPASVPLAAPAPAADHEAVEGDLLPPVGARVLIHLARQDAWVEHTVTGYCAWGDFGGNDSLHRVFVRVVDADGYSNARLLKDVRSTASAVTDTDKEAK